MEVLRVKTVRRTQLVDVTDLVEKAVAKAGVASGMCHVFVPHTTAGLIINEHFDPMWRRIWKVCLSGWSPDRGRTDMRRGIPIHTPRRF